MTYQDEYDGSTQLIRFADGEHFKEIKEDLDNLIKSGVQLESITSDGRKSILFKAMKLPKASLLGILEQTQLNILYVSAHPIHGFVSKTTHFDTKGHIHLSDHAKNKVQYQHICAWHSSQELYNFTPTQI